MKLDIKSRSEIMKSLPNPETFEGEEYTHILTDPIELQNKSKIKQLVFIRILHNGKYEWVIKY